MGLLDGKVALITGGSSGIGLATAKAFQREGASIVISGRNAERLDQAVEELGGRAISVRADAGAITDMERVIDTTVKKYGHIDVMFLNAGPGGHFAPFEEVDESLFDAFVDTNFKGPYFTIQKALPYLAQDASIILNSSITAFGGEPNMTAYAAAKAALRSLARTLATELGPSGIRVNVVSPGFIDTPIFSKSGLPDDAKGELYKGVAEQSSLGRVGKAEEIAEAVVFLASQRSSYVIGSEIVVDGGYSITT